MDKVDFKSFDNEVIKGYLFVSKSKPKGIVQIVHGLEEHGLRYTQFARFLNDNGYIVFASDQRLHGETAGDKLSMTKIRNVFPVMVQDQIEISKMLKAKYDLPLFIFGHSYGSFIVQSYLQNYHYYTGAILSGSAYMKRFEVLAGKYLAWSIVKLKGGEENSKLLENLVISSFNKSFKDGESWISANKENVRKYEEDPLCGKPLCANFYYSMFKNTHDLYEKERLNHIDKNKPILILSGNDDPVGKMGKSVKKLYETYKSFDINCNLKIYEGMRHEILNEGDEKVQQDILQFLDSTIKNTI